MERPDHLSPVATLCLAILCHGEATGYEIKKASTARAFSYFVDASFGAIYPALARLAADGLLTQREEVQTGRPSRKVYAITAKGREALMGALSGLPGGDVFRSPFLLMAKFAAHLPRGVVEAALEERRRWLTAELAHVDEIARAHEDPSSRWILDYARACLDANLAFMEANAHRLAAIAPAPADAARVAAE